MSTSDVKVAYKGYFTDGSVFDESSAAGITFNLQGVIAGWTEGIPFFKEGGTGKLLLPSALGYGKSGTNGIPKNSVLIFDIELLQVL
jgi:FKBP-type peptidyl-prolyl cis-trans isomerase FkpA